MDFTEDQKKVLQDRNDRLLVSASAGSGKTATIIQKIFELINNDKINLEELLVITFTESASMEMKIRLKDLLKEHAKDNKHIREQLEKISVSDISTLHAYCAKMIRKYFYLLNLKPNFIVLDENDAKFLKIKALDKILRDYAKNNDNDFESLSAIFGGGRSFENLKSSILSYYDFLQGISDKEDFIKNISLSCYNEDLNNNPACQYLNKYIYTNCDYILRNLNKFKLMAEQNIAEFFVKFIDKVITLFGGISKNNSLSDNQTAIINLTLPRMTNKKLEPSDADFKEDFKPFWEEMRKRVNSLKKFSIERNEDEIKLDLRTAKNTLIKFNEVEEHFDNLYQDLKNKRNGLDFNDLEKYFVELLKRNDIKDSINYKYIFVDEYQDINCVQESILSVLSSKCKMVMVGDIKQSIYGFRNSTPEIFINKVKDYTEDDDLGKLISLNENFRSNPIILEFVNEIFKKCMSIDFGGVDYKNKGELQGKSTYKTVNNFPIVEVDIVNSKSKDKENDEESTTTYSGVYSVLEDKNEYTSLLNETRKEAMIVAERIKDCLEKTYYNAKEKKENKITFSDFAILCRKNEFLKEVAKVLMEYKIPVAIDLVENVYKNKDVEPLLSLLKLINNFHDDQALATALISPFANLTYDELARMRLLFPYEKFFYDVVKNTAELYNTKLQSKEKLEDDLEQIGEKINSFYMLLQDMKNQLTYNSISAILNYVCDKYDYFNFVYSLPDGANRVKSVRDFIEGFYGADYDYDLVGYLDFVKNYAYEGKFKASFTGGSDSVKLGTIHSSKGLEYPIVFLVGCGEGFSKQLYKEEILKDKDFGLGVHTFNLSTQEKLPNVARNSITLFKSKQERAEELRLLYVALTRAKNHLIVIGECDLEKLKSVNDLDDAEGANNYLTWILKSLTTYNFKSLIIKKDQTVQKLTSGSVLYKVYNDDDFILKGNEEKPFTFAKSSKKDCDKLKNILDFDFPKFENIALKNSVSSLLFENSQQMENFNYSPEKLTIYEGKKEGIIQSKLGTYYHAIMEKIDFNKSFDKTIFDDIIAQLNPEEDYLKYIEFDKIKTCIETLKSLNITSVKKELPFISYIPYNDIFDSPITDKVIVQGIADLVVISNNKNYLVDYKITKGNNTDQLVGKYRVQLLLYKICLEKALHVTFDNVYIYSFYFDKLIEVKL